MSFSTHGGEAGERLLFDGRHEKLDPLLPASIHLVTLTCCNQRVLRDAAAIAPWGLSAQAVALMLTLLSWKPGVQVSDHVLPEYESSQARNRATRAVERCLCEVCLVWTTARLLEGCSPPDVKKDFVFHLRSLLEHAPPRDRQDVSHMPMPSN